LIAQQDNTLYNMFLLSSLDGVEACRLQED
jgi:hypothetical protein